ncbi:MAG: transcriptional regulator [Gammaproteobacteria bacterium]|nr:transcriptional regulator [Gammaproteobacteria bacterium]
MHIEGPLKILMADPADGQGKLLMISFQPEFIALDLAVQGEAFRGHIAQLGEHIQGLPEDDRNRMGMLIVQQFSEQLLPHIEQGEIELSETMIIQIRQDDQVVALTDLLENSPGSA